MVLKKYCFKIRAFSVFSFLITKMLLSRLFWSPCIFASHHLPNPSCNLSNTVVSFYFFSSRFMPLFSVCALKFHKTDVEVWKFWCKTGHFSKALTEGCKAELLIQFWDFFSLPKNCKAASMGCKAPNGPLGRGSRRRD